MTTDRCGYVMVGKSGRWVYGSGDWADELLEVVLTRSNFLVNLL